MAKVFSETNGDFKTLKRIVAHVCMIETEGKICCWCTHCGGAWDEPENTRAAREMIESFNTKHKKCKNNK